MPPVLLLLVPYLRPALPYLLVGAAVLAVLGYAYHRGAVAVRHEVSRAALVTDQRNEETRRAVERDVARMPDPTAELLRRWGRD